MCSKYKFTFLLFLTYVVFPPVLLSAPQITINTYSSSIITGLEFEAGFSATDLLPDTDYYSKSLGGIDFNEVDTWNFDWLQQNAPWASMPVFTSNSEGSSSATIKSRFALTTSPGNKEYKIRIRKVDASTNYDSTTVQITVNTPAPTSTLTQPTNELTPSPTSTPIPTTYKSATPQPTKISTPKPTKVRTDEPTNTQEPGVLGASETSLSSPTPNEVIIKDEMKFPFVPFVFILSGVLLIVIAVYNLVRARQNSVQG